MKLEFCNGDFRALKALVLSTFAGVPLATSDSKASNDNFSDAQTPPVLYLDQGELHEPGAILRHIARRSSNQQSLQGTSLFEQAEVDEWLCWCVRALEPAVQACLALAFTPHSDDARAALPAKHEQLRSVLGQLETRLQKNAQRMAYLTGDRLTMADVAIVCALRYPFNFLVGAGEMGNVTRYFVACASLPEFVQVCGTPFLCERPFEPAPQPTDRFFKTMDAKQEDDQVAFADLSTDAGLDELNEYFRLRTYVFNNRLTKADSKLLKLVESGLLKAQPPSLRPNATTHPHAARWFALVTRRLRALSSSALRKLEPPKPLSLVVRQRRGVVPEKKVPAKEHGLYKGHFEKVARGIPRAGVEARMLAAGLDPAVLDTPDKLIAVSTQLYDKSDPYAARPLSTLNKKEIMNLLIRAHQTQDLEDETLSSVDLSGFATAMRKQKAKKKYNGASLCKWTATECRSIPDFEPSADAVDSLLAIIEEFKHGDRLLEAIFLSPKKTVKKAPKKDPNEPVVVVEEGDAKGDPRVKLICEDNFFNIKFKPKKSQVSVTMKHLNPRAEGEHTGTLRELLSWVDESGISGDDTLIAFDFDYTLKGNSDPVTGKVGIRDEENSLYVLKELAKRNVNMIIVTARQPSHIDWGSVKDRMTEIGLRPFIGQARRVDEDDRRQISLLFGQAREQSLAKCKQHNKKHKKSKKSQIKLGKDYALVSDVHKLFAEGYYNRFKGGEDEAANRFGSALVRTSVLTREQLDSASDDLTPDAVKMTLKQAQECVALSLPPRQLEPPLNKKDERKDEEGNDLPPRYPRMQSESGKFVFDCWEALDSNDHAMVCGEGMCMSRHYKPQCVHSYIDIYQLKPKHIIFVDDFVQNALDFGWYFACERAPTWTNRETMPASSVEKVTSVWWDAEILHDENERNRIIKEQLLKAKAEAEKTQSKSDENASEAKAEESSSPSAEASAAAASATAEEKTEEKTEDETADETEDAQTNFTERSSSSQYDQSRENIQRGTFSEQEFYPYY